MKDIQRLQLKRQSKHSLPRAELTAAQMEFAKVRKNLKKMSIPVRMKRLLYIVYSVDPTEEMSEFLKVNFKEELTQLRRANQLRLEDDELIQDAANRFKNLKSK